jgi:hypothetical protein
MIEHEATLVVVDTGIRWGRWLSAACFVALMWVAYTMQRNSREIKVLAQQIKDIHDSVGGLPVGDVKLVMRALDEAAGNIQKSIELARHQISSNHDELDGELRMSNEKLSWLRNKLNFFFTVPPPDQAKIDQVDSKRIGSDDDHT